MDVAQHIAIGTEQSLASVGLGDSPLQIRMNPFSAAADRAPIADPRIHLLQQASRTGRFNLFTSAALDLIVEGSQKAPGRLSAAAQLAFFAAASEGACQIHPRHVAHALAALAPLHDDKTTATQELPGDMPPDRAVEEAVLEYPSAATAEEKEDGTNPDDREAGYAAQVLQIVDAPCPEPAKKPVARLERRWGVSVAAVCSAVVAIFVVAGVISSTLSSRPSITTYAVPVPPAEVPAALKAAVVEAPAPAETASLPVPDPQPAQASGSDGQAGSQRDGGQTISAPAPKKLATTTTGKRKKKPTPRKAAQSRMDREARAAADSRSRPRADERASGAAQHIIQANEDAALAAAIKEAEDKAQAESEAARRVAEEKAAAKRAVVEVLASDRARALGESVPQTTPMPDAVQAEKDSADSVKAKEEEKSKGGFRFGAKGLRLF